MRRRIDVYRAARHADEADNFGMLLDGQVLNDVSFKTVVHCVHLLGNLYAQIIADITLLKAIRKSEGCADKVGER